MVSQYGGTFGHRAQNIRVVGTKTQTHLTVPRAIVRSMVKQGLGLFSLGFMFATKRAQSLHDLAAGSEVRVRDSQHAGATDYFVPEQLPPGQALPPTGRRIVVIAIYGLAVFVLVSVMGAVTMSQACVNNGDVCTEAERQTANLLGWTLLVAFAALVSLGWTGRLPGCRRRATQISESDPGYKTLR